jgi:hypothetical protein
VKVQFPEEPGDPDRRQFGQPSPLPIEDQANADERRSVGLGPLAEDVRRRRENRAHTREQPPQDWARRQRDMEAWAQAVGWRG